MCRRKFRPIKYMRRYSYAKFGTFFLGHPVLTLITKPTKLFLARANVFILQKVQKRKSSLNEWAYSLDRKIIQSVKQEYRGTITACTYKCFESTIIQLRATIDYIGLYVTIIKTQHYENKSCLVIKRTKTHTRNVTQRTEKNTEQ